jgi:hypothetical protein
MRTLAILGGVGLWTAAALAQQPHTTEFATNGRGEPVPVVGVTVLPPPCVVAAPVSHVCYTPKMLSKLPECELIRIYKCGTPAPVPKCYTPGLVIFKPGSHITGLTSQVMKCGPWQGKYFPDCHIMVNKMFWVPTIKAEIMPGESWLDGGPTMVFDYAETSIVWQQYRDEVREVSPGVILGIMHRRTKHGPKIATWFALDARGNGCCAGPHAEKSKKGLSGFLP